MSNLRSYNSRNKHKTVANFCRLSKYFNSYAVLALKIYNKLEHLIRKYPENTFKRLQLAVDIPFYST